MSETESAWGGELQVGMRGQRPSRACLTQGHDGTVHSGIYTMHADGPQVPSAPGMHRLPLLAVSGQAAFLHCEEPGLTQQGSAPTPLAGECSSATHSHIPSPGESLCLHSPSTLCGLFVDLPRVSGRIFAEGLWGRGLGMGEAAGPTLLLWLLCVTVTKASDTMKPSKTPLGAVPPSVCCAWSPGAVRHSPTCS